MYNMKKNIMVENKHLYHNLIIRLQPNKTKIIATYLDVNLDLLNLLIWVSKDLIKSNYDCENLQFIVDLNYQLA